MSLVAFIDLAQMLQDAGFPGGTSQQQGISIVCAESGRDPAAKHVNADGSIDRGLWQINSVAHPEVADADAYDPVKATAAAFKISNNGTSYGPWTTFTNGAYHVHMEAAAVALDGASRVRKLQASLNSEQQQLAAAQAQVASLQTQLSDAQAQTASLQAKIDAAKGDLA